MFYGVPNTAAGSFLQCVESLNVFKAVLALNSFPLHVCINPGDCCSAANSRRRSFRSYSGNEFAQYINIYVDSLQLEGTISSYYAHLFYRKSIL